MAKSLVLFDNQLDALWLPFLRRLGDGEDTEVLNLDTQRRAGLGVHSADVLSWIRLFRRDQVGSVHCYKPGGRAVAALIAAAVLKIRCTLYVTSYPARRLLMGLGMAARSGSFEFSCATEFIGRRLQEWGVDRGRITVCSPEMQIGSPSQSERASVRSGITPAGLILLAAAPPRESRALTLAIRTATMLKYTVGELVLVVAGAATSAERECMLRQQRIWRSGDMLRLDGNANSYDRLCAAADVVISTERHPAEPIRLLCARQMGARIVTVPGDAGGLPANHSGLGVASDATAISLAACVWPFVSSRRSDD